MNHNILSKIINKVVYNRWQQKINQINGEYHRYFVLSDGIDKLGYHLKLRSSYCIWQGIMFYNWRQPQYCRGNIYSHKICYCISCKKVHPQNTLIR